MQMFSCEYCEISTSIYFEEHPRTAASDVTLGSDSLRLSFWRVAFKTILTCNITKILQSLSNQSFKYNLAHMLSLNLISTLSFEPTVMTEKVNACSPWTSCSFHFLC